VEKKLRGGAFQEPRSFKKEGDDLHRAFEKGRSHGLRRVMEGDGKLPMKAFGRERRGGKGAKIRPRRDRMGRKDQRIGGET